MLPTVMLYFTSNCTKNRYYVAKIMNFKTPVIYLHPFIIRWETVLCKKKNFFLNNTNKK